MRVLAAGFGAMAILRSSLFTISVDKAEIPVGPAAVLQIVLAAADRSVDRQRAQSRSAVVAEVMADVDFDKARLPLPSYCLALMQNVSAEEAAQVRQEVDALAQADMNPAVKSLDLGLYLMNVVGESVLADARAALDEHILRSEPDTAALRAILADVIELPYDAVIVPLTRICLALSGHDDEALTERVSQELAAIDAADSDDRLKSIEMAATLYRHFGKPVVTAALGIVRDQELTSKA